MSTNSSLDRESFQQLLAAAFAVQESRMDTQSLSAIIEIQRLITAGDLDVDAAVHVIANHARNVANAAGVAIGLIQGHQLVYRAGIGSAAPYAGRHITATLSVSADTKMGREILRVENAQTDARIEAAICRQFGAESLLIMPIYQGQTLTGVLEVLFSEAHAFEEREVRAYRLMAGLVGEAMSRAAKHETEGSRAEVLPLATKQATAQMQKFATEANADDNYVADPANENAPYHLYEAASALAGKLPAFWRLPGAARMIRQRVQRLPLHTSQWSAAIAAVVVIMIFGWTAYGNRRPVAPGTPVLRTSNAADPHVEAASANPVPVSATSQSQSASGANSTKPSRSAFKRVRVGENEIDYIADDVTVRHFIPSPSQQRVQAGYNQVEFGKDVTVRYFASNGAAASSTPAAGVVQPVNRTLPEPDKSVTRKLAR